MEQRKILSEYERGWPVMAVPSFPEKGKHMGKITHLEVQGYTEWSSATYVDDEGEEYEIVFTKNYTHNIGYEEREVVNVKRGGIGIDSDDPIWKEIRKTVEKGGDA